MSRKLALNLVLICLLVLLFPLLWLFNQRSNYRSFLTLNTKFSIDSNTIPPKELSSVHYIYHYLKDNGVEAELDVDVKTPETFMVLGRIIITPRGNIEVYEYSSNSDAKEQLEELEDHPEIVENTYLYKNLLIYNVGEIPEVSKLLEGL